MRFVVLAYGPLAPPGPGLLAEVALGSADTATVVRDGVLVFDQPASALAGLQLVDASSLDSVLDALPSTGLFEIRPAGAP
jgi:hypothetical protein